VFLQARAVFIRRAQLAASAFKRSSYRDAALCGYRVTHSWPHYPITPRHLHHNVYAEPHPAGCYSLRLKDPHKPNRGDCIDAPLVRAAFSTARSPAAAHSVLAIGHQDSARVPARPFNGNP
jgi:hypothetical protein